MRRGVDGSGCLNAHAHGRSHSKSRTHAQEMPPRQSLRPRTQRRVVEINNSGDEEDEDGSGTISSAGSVQEDEWQPESRRAKGKRGRGVSLSSNSSSSSSSSPSHAKKQRKSSDPTTDNEPRAAYDENIEDDAERERLQREAKEAWEQVRAKKKGQDDDGSAGGGKEIPTASSKPPHSTPAPSTLNSWLGLPPIPWPTSPESSRIFDRDSLFIGFAYPLESSTQSNITPILNHLTSQVHPTLPSKIFPLAFSHLDPKRRGSSHDIQAYRVLELKRGRNGLAGPNDFGLEEKFDDDGERWAGEKILKVMKELGAVDLIVIVSRWYGGTNLGPVRFEHITKCARETVKAFMLQETLKPLRDQLVTLDKQIRNLKVELHLGPSTQLETDSYSDLNDPDKAQRLINARTKQIEMLKKRIEVGQKHKNDAQQVKPPAKDIPRPPTPPKAEPDTDLLQGWDDLA